MKRLIFILVSLTLLPAGATAGEPAQSEVQAREAVFYQAFLDADRGAMDDIFADDFLYQHGSGATFTEAQFLDIIGSGAVRVTRADMPVLEFRDFGNVMVTYGQGVVEGVQGKEAFGGVLRFVNVWGRASDDVWRLHHRNSEFLPSTDE